jgi:hypothetical protein
MVFPSETRRGERDKAARTRRREQNQRHDEATLAAMRRAIAKGVDRDAAIIAAVRARVVFAIGRRWGLRMYQHHAGRRRSDRKQDHHGLRTKCQTRVCGRC